MKTLLIVEHNLTVYYSFYGPQQNYKFFTLENVMAEC